MTRCARCKVRLIRQPINWQGMTLGPVCARRLGYVPPASESAGKVAKRKRVRHSRDEATPDMFAIELITGIPGAHKLVMS